MLDRDRPLALCRAVFWLQSTSLLVNAAHMVVEVIRVVRAFARVELVWCGELRLGALMVVGERLVKDFLRRCLVDTMTCWHRSCHPGLRVLRQGSGRAATHSSTLRTAPACRLLALRCGMADRHRH